MLPFDVPFVPDDGYADFLAAHADRLSSVHFSVADRRLSDARQRLAPTDLDATIKGLVRLKGVDRYVLMNARLHEPEAYFDQKRLDDSARLLDVLIEQAGITGLIFADPYFLQALADARPETAAQLEAVPSVNAMLDSADKVHAMIAMINGTAFKPPSRIVLDRSLNRDRKDLTDTVAHLRASRPGLKIHLIANEGCLYQCPYKPAHDAHVALVNERLCGERTFAMNRDFGCVRRMLTDSSAMLASPFIRPEDLTSYEPMANAVKLCGRNRGIPFLKQVVEAYVNGAYDGNLLDLMDAMGDLADRVVIPNADIPSNFLAHVWSCDKYCSACGWCGRLADRIARRETPGLEHR